MLALGKLLELTLAGREPSEKIQVCASGARLQWKVEGVLAVDPPAGRDRGVDLLLSAGIHGDETAPVELLERLLHDIAACRLVPALRLLLVLGNPAALRRGERYVEYDLNRLFGGRDPSASGADALRAVELELQAEQFFAQAGRRRRHYDLHAATRASLLGPFALRPPSARSLSRDQLADLQAAGLQALVLHGEPSATFSAFTSESCAAEAFAFELGQARPLGQNAAVDLGRTEAWLRALIEGCEPAAVGDPAALQLFRSARQLIKHSDAFRLYLDEAVANFTALPPGSLLAEDAEGRRWLVEEADARIVFANPRVAVGQRAGLIVVPVALAAVCA
ncbi:MAG TPA: succinylglutamate desuccinylase [Pseudomonas sp.]|nr:succinylglutamate desuccinylase [Pseudomonas sp.]